MQASLRHTQCAKFTSSPACRDIQRGFGSCLCVAYRRHYSVSPGHLRAGAGRQARPTPYQ